MMELDLAMRELRDNNEGLRKQYRLRTLRRILRILLIGFLMGRHADRKIVELTTRNDHTINSIRNHFEELATVCSQISEISSSNEKQCLAALSSFEKDLKSVIDSKILDEDLILSNEGGSQAFRESISKYVRKLIGNHMEMATKQIQEIENSGTYLVRTNEEKATMNLRSLEETLSYFGSHNLLDERSISSLKDRLQKDLQAILDYNKEFIKQRRRDYSLLFEKENISLDDEQKDAVITDDQYNLVIAGAGAGKTEVLITRIAYLVERRPDSVKPDRILAIAFQDKAKREIEDRLHDRYKIGGVNVRTFHKLGKDIIESAHERKIKHTEIVDENKRSEIVRRLYEQKLKDQPEYYKLFLSCVRTFRESERTEHLDEKEDNLAFKQALRYVSINNKHVRSRAEKEILDFLLTHKLNGMRIQVEYEPDVGEFRPDFLLPKFDLFIEHWALDEKGEVPKNWGIRASEDYKENMRRKKDWFAKNDKLLVETYAFEYDEYNTERFLEILKQRITDKLRTLSLGNVEFSPMSYDEIVEVAWAPYKDPIPEDIVNFIKNAKVYGLTPEKIEERLRNEKWTRKQLTFGKLALEVYTSYEKEIHEQSRIDFEDMINEAVEELRKNENLYTNVYDHILVDEYQDISKQRCKILSELLHRNPGCKLFSVGDDWQSIMGFAGSNLNFFVNFERYFEKPAITKISTNYRSTKSIVDAGAAVIRKNGSCQIAKPTLAYRQESKPIRVLVSTHKKDFETRYYEQTVDDCLDQITDYIKRGYKPRDILVLNRYKSPYVVKVFLERAKRRDLNVAFDSEFARENQIRLMTVHKSKGLEAKVVFVLDVIKGTYGFPCEIEDSSIYGPAREDYPPQDHKEEERRLFYVAVTRAKEDLTIYTWEPSKSEFLEEIKDHVDEIPLYY